MTSTLLHANLTIAGTLLSAASKFDGLSADFKVISDTSRCREPADVYYMHLYNACHVYVHPPKDGVTEDPNKS